MKKQRSPKDKPSSQSKLMATSKLELGSCNSQLRILSTIVRFCYLFSLSPPQCWVAAACFPEGCTPCVLTFLQL